MLLIGGKTLVPFVSAAVIQRLGWHWVFIIVGIIVTVMFALTFFCVPETCWDRTPSPVSQLDSNQGSQPKSAFQAPQKFEQPAQGNEKSANQVTVPISEEDGSGRIQKKPYAESLALYQGRLVQEEWWKCALKPFILFSYPAVAYVP